MKKLLAVALGLAVVAPAFAADSSSGCGLGWYVFKKNSLVSSTLRATTNGLFFNNTFGMTFGTSNCAKHEIVQRDKEPVYYAEANHEVLAIEMAEGKGEYVAGFARTLGCDDSVVGDFSKMTQEKYPSIMTSPSVSGVEMLDNVKREMKNNVALALHCRV